MSELGLLEGKNDVTRSEGKEARSSTTTASTLTSRKERTHITSQLLPIPPKVLPKQTKIPGLRVSKEDGQVVLKELWEILSVEVVEELKEKEEGLGELRKGSCGWELGSWEGEELIGSLWGGKGGRGCDGQREAVEGEEGRRWWMDG